MLTKKDFKIICEAIMDAPLATIEERFVVMNYMAGRLNENYHHFDSNKFKRYALDYEDRKANKIRRVK